VKNNSTVEAAEMQLKNAGLRDYLDRLFSGDRMPAENVQRRCTT
jgi:hypothetical protein